MNALAPARAGLALLVIARSASDEAIQSGKARPLWIASLRSQ